MNINHDESKNKKKSMIWIYIIFFTIIIIGIILLFVKIFNRKPILEFEDFYNQNKYPQNFNDKIYIEKKNHTLSGKSYNDSYKICAYGAKALKGGRGCVICGIYKVKKSLEIQYKLGGREAGGKGGRDCGAYDKNDGSDGAGCTIIENLEKILLVAGGGGGNSEEEYKTEKILNRGGDCEEDGEGKLGGKKGEINKGGKSGGNGQNGIQFKGGNATNSKWPKDFCGGGGGDGYFGGGAGGYGGEGENGGGGGGSNYCNVEFLEKGKSDMEYSGIRIYRFE